MGRLRGQHTVDSGAAIIFAMRPHSAALNSKITATLEDDSNKTNRDFPAGRADSPVIQLSHGKLTSVFLEGIYTV